jgi:ribosomal protein S12 methylthiotransferase
MSKRSPTMVALVSLGCPKNLVDSEKILAELAEHGCVVCAEAADADVIVVNTCGFLEAAREESLNVIRDALAQKAAGAAKRVVVAGCLAQRDGAELGKLLPGIDAIVGVNNRDDIALAVTGKGKFTAAEGYKAHLRRLGQAGRPVLSDAGRFRLTPRHTAYLRISEGCGQGCTFCTIPAIRGPFRSKPLHQVLDEARELIADGTVELNIIGQDTTSYGLDIGYREGLAGLLRELDALQGVRWIRLLYGYPSLVSDAIIDALAECPRVVKYMDLPLQHIADPVLAAMRRRITRGETEALLERLRRRVPGLALRTTFIVGFPGETEADFHSLLGFVKAFRFDAVGVFEYSKEAGTIAAGLDGEVPPQVARARREALMLAQQEIVFAANAASVGGELEVLVDGVDARGRCVGRHAGQAPEVDSLCYLKARRPEGAFVAAEVVGWEDYDLVVRPTKSAKAKNKRVERRK